MIKHSELLELLRTELGTTDDCALQVLDADAAISDMGLDSLVFASVIVTVAAAYRISLPADEVVSLLSSPTIRDLATALEHSLAENPKSTRT